ncbi:UNVERIFIED_CONTAM: hypothetical protein PYX00_011263 [Menopon gallinae]|uniref:C2H2-type domain-containing protein n=1 Tax=Menopon gallinae TaxID=328185 RepID=A0AAW2H7A8_9NEOP
MGRGRRDEGAMTQVDIFFLLNQRKVLTKKEFLAVLPRASYLSYVQAFYKRKLNKIFSTCSDSEWFRRRYVDGGAPGCSEAAARLRAFLDNSAWSTGERFCDYYCNNILVKNIPDTMAYEDIEDLARKCLYFREFSTYQQEQRRSFGRVGVISIGGDCDEALRFMESVTDRSLKIVFEAVQFDGVKVRRCGLRGKGVAEAARDVLATLLERCMQHVPDAVPGSSSSVLCIIDKRAEASGQPLDFYAAALRRVFLFCIFCYRQYDTVYEMRALCGDWHVSADDAEESADARRMFFRKHEIYMGCRKDSERFKCDCCVKVFSSAEFAKNHVRNKHPDVMERVRARIEVFNRFVDGLDFFMASCLSGTDDPHMPSFIDMAERVEGVRYMDRVFSGEVHIGRR